MPNDYVPFILKLSLPHDAWISPDTAAKASLSFEGSVPPAIAMSGLPPPNNLENKR